MAPYEDMFIFFRIVNTVHLNLFLFSFLKKGSLSLLACPHGGLWQRLRPILVFKVFLLFL